jgi:hypothetical protein
VSASTLPLRCVVDTNVATTANGANAGAPPACMAASGRALYEVMQRGHVFLDAGGRIVAEYRAHLSPRGQPGPGDAFFKWLLTFEWSGKRVTRVTITPCDGVDGEDYRELPPPPEGVRYDPSDRKFLAVTAAHPEHPPILQSFDSKWWGWRAALGRVGVRVVFLCEDDIRRKHEEKMA